MCNKNFVSMYPNYGICNVGISPLRAEASDRSEMVSQLLFGDSFEILEEVERFIKIRTAYDDYEGWMDPKQKFDISEKQFQVLRSASGVYVKNFYDSLTYGTNGFLPIPMGSELTFLQFEDINKTNYLSELTASKEVFKKSNLILTAYNYLNTPYLWGGKSPFGIDCSGLTQMVYKLNGIKISRDASQQAMQGEVLSFIEESEPGDLAFFDNEEGKIIHVGIIMENNHIIHASGKVRIDRLDHLGIYNEETRKHTHKLRVIKKII